MKADLLAGCNEITLADPRAATSKAVEPSGWSVRSIAVGRGTCLQSDNCLDRLVSMRAAGLKLHRPSSLLPRFRRDPLEAILRKVRQR